MSGPRPHILGIDDGPFEKAQPHPADIVAVAMEGCDLVESVAIGAFSVDGDAATEYLAEWILTLRVLPSIQVIMLGGITIAGLGVVDVESLAKAIERPVLVVNRKNPRDSRLPEALAAAGLRSRIAVVERTPPAVRSHYGLFIAAAGTSVEQAQRWVQLSLRKAQIPEPLRVAHLIARALATGQSRGRA
jgi:endonuclease V-like protein UPF0215 family